MLLPSVRNRRLRLALLLGFAVVATPPIAAGKQAGAAQDWPTVGGGSGSARYSKLAEINTRRVGKLGGAWVRDLGAATRAAPLVVDGTMYTVDGTRIYALDARTGAFRWEYQPEDSTPARGGVTVADGKVYCGLADTHVIALDARTGKLAWEWWVTPSPGEPGSETWPDDIDATALGGGAIWNHGAADAILGLVCFGTGNASPIFGGEVRPGDNLYMASIVTVDVATGKLEWHYQLTRHDLWEMDVSTPPILYDAKLGGKERRALAVMRTDGYLFIFDRATGEPLVPIEERPVPQDLRVRTVATQPFPAGTEQFGPNCVPKELLAPGFRASCYFGPIFYDRNDMLDLFANVRQAPMSYDPALRQFYVAGGAIDGRTHKISWRQSSPRVQIANGGLMSIAGGLVFRSEGDGNFSAAEAATGATLWRFQTGALSGPSVNSLTSGGLTRSTPWRASSMSRSRPASCSGPSSWAGSSTTGGPPRPCRRKNTASKVSSRRWDTATR